MADHIGVSGRAWRQWGDERTDLLPVIEWAEEVCDNQMLEGAIVGQFNANIISRLLGNSGINRQQKTLSNTFQPPKVT